MPVPVVDVLHGDSLDLMAEMPSASIHAIVTDPPYSIGFMERAWDSHASPAAFQEWCRRWAVEALRILRPGGYLLAFGGSRTYHRLACGIEDAGFEMRDAIQWVYASGFPKGRNAATAAGDDRWEGWSTALKPSYETITVARRPLGGQLGANLNEYQTGALNIDGCRIPYLSPADQASAIPQGRATSSPAGTLHEPDAARDLDRVDFEADNTKGRWPTDLLLTHHPDCLPAGPVTIPGDDRSSRQAVGTRPRVFAPGAEPGSDRPNGQLYGDQVIDSWTCVPGCPVQLLDTQAGPRTSGMPGTMRSGLNTGSALGSESRPPGTPMTGYGDSGGASRFYPTFAWDHELDVPFIFQGKAARSERDAGLHDFARRPLRWSNGDVNPGSFQSAVTDRSERNPHPTVKPVELMRWLLRLVTPAGGHILDPFVGSGSTGVAAAIEGVRLTGIELDADHVDVARARIAHAQRLRNRILTGRSSLRAAPQPAADAAQSSLW